MTAVNLGGAGEIPGVLNQQPAFARDPTWRDRFGRTLQQALAAGEQYLICPNDALTIQSDTVEVVYTNNIPLDKRTWRGPGVQSSEIRRILKPGGVWIHNRRVRYRKP